MLHAFRLRSNTPTEGKYMNTHIIAHPKGTKAKLLLSSVFGPFAQDDEYGSRAVNPMELYQNQVTRVQGVFSLRMFHRSFGLMLIQSNIEAPCVLLDFPTLKRFIEELKHHPYDIIGISGIIPNVGKVKKMCELIRQYQPNATIVVGGHISNKAGIETSIDADHIVKGDGIEWFRRFLGQRLDKPVRHPMALSAFGTRTMGIRQREAPGNTAAIVIPSVGCPVGCNFCSTSALFGGKGNSINFYETGDELFAVMCRIEKQLKVRSFFILDENFLFHRKRALRLLELLHAHGKSWLLSVFSSARVIRSYSIEQIVGLGIGWIWMGIEGKASGYRKLKDVDTRELVKQLQANGIRVLGSSIIGLEDHTPDTIDEVIDHAVRHQTDFHQFMLYMPNPGTPLYEAYRQKGVLLEDAEFSPADTHGQYRFSYRHDHIHSNREQDFLLKAFQRDFERNGPSLARLIRTLLTGWQKYKNHSDPRIRARFLWEAKPLRSTYAGLVWAMKRYYRNDRRMFIKLDGLLNDICREFSWQPRFTAPLIGILTYLSMLMEEKRLSRGWQYEPTCFYEKNNAALAIENPAPNPFHSKFIKNPAQLAEMKPLR
jgi:radical SAM superfamily enzyme YgiQ (UPF0313 family)